MIHIFKTAENDLKPMVQPEEDSWVNVTAPSLSEITRLAEELEIPFSFLADPLDVDERSRLEREEGHLLIIVRVPFHEEDSQSGIPFSTLPLGIIFSEKKIITICRRPLPFVEDFIGKRVRFSTEDKTSFLCQMLLKVTLLYMTHLKQINAMTSRIEQELQHSMRNEELISLLNCEKSLVFFTTSLKSNEFMIDRLSRIPFLKFSEEDRDRLDDIIVENRQAVEMANIYSNILSGMMDAFASVISNNLTVVMKFLTSVTIILMLPTLVASIYGMNVSIPFQQSPHAFLITLGISVGLSIVAVIFFWKRRWF